MRDFYITLCVSSLIFSSFQVNANIALTELKLADSALQKCVNEHASKNNWKLVSEVDTLKCNGMEIENLDGLHVLTQLKSLSLYNNKLEEADLHLFTQLEHLNIASNKLKTVNVTGLHKLSTLYLFKNNLKEIELTGLLQLKKIRITNNKLKNLDISSLTSLEKAYFFDNQLEDLIVKGLPNLTFIELRQNPMPDEVYDRYDAIEGVTIVHDGNADDWK
jgi:Leucine-rich repeat (LRR) protein